MAKDDHSNPSFSPGRKWSIALNVVLLTFFVFAVVVMVNYLSRDYFYRIHTGVHQRMQLAPQTMALLKSITNRVTVILYYDKNNVLYDTVADLLTEFQDLNPRIKVRKVDYLHDASAAKEIQAMYRLGSMGDKELAAKDLVIFDCEGRFKIVPGQMLAKYVQERIPDEKEVHMLRRPVQFLGETAFDAALMNVVNPRPLKAYFLTLHGEGQIASKDGLSGYYKFAELLGTENVASEPLSLLGTNLVPADCNLLVIAGPQSDIAPYQLEKIHRYLGEGGRLLALFNYASQKNEQDAGLVKLLALWGVEVGDNSVRDPDNTQSSSDVVVYDFSPKHSVSSPFIGSGSALQMYMPRTVGRLSARAPADAPTVEELIFTGPNAQVFVNNQEAGKPRKVSLMAAAEKGAIRDVKNERGTTRIIVAGDSVFLANTGLDAAANRDFAKNIINWLLERSELVQGPAPQRVDSYTLVMTNAQLRNAEWILLAALPGGVLVLGLLIWLRRRR